MRAELPAEIEVVEPPEGGILYRLPRRPPLMRLVGLVPMLFGAFIFSWPLLGALFFLFVGGMKGEGFWPSLLLPLGCFGPVAFPLGGFLLAIGLFTTFGHNEVGFGDGRLTSVARCGPFRWSGSRPLDQIRGFNVAHTAAPNTRADAPENVSRLVATLGDGRTWTVCSGYPRTLLLPLARELARQCEREAAPEGAGDTISIGVSEESTNPERIEERQTQPHGSTAVLEERASGFSITIPPRGLRGCHGFGVVWTLAWNGMLAVLAPLFLWLTMSGEMKWQDGPERVSLLFMFLLLSPFILVGIGSLLWLVHQMRRSAVIEVEPERLEVAETGVFGTSRYSWDRDALAGVGVESAYTEGSEGGGSWETQLRVELREDKSIRLLGYRPKAELEWIATRLRTTLKIVDIPNPVRRGG
jgi:hypothetical protein